MSLRERLIALAADYDESPSGAARLALAAAAMALEGAVKQCLDIGYSHTAGLNQGYAHVGIECADAVRALADEVKA